MHGIQQSVRGLALLIDLTWDRLFFPAAITVALAGAAYLGSL